MDVILVIFMVYVRQIHFCFIFSELFLTVV